MSHNPGNKKANKRRKRNTNQSGAQKQQAQQQQSAPQDTAPESSDSSSTNTQAKQPTSRRTTRKEAAQAEAKKKRQLQMIIGGVAAAALIVVVFILINRPTSTGVEIDYSGLEVAQSDIVQGFGTPSADQGDGVLTFATGSTVGDPNAPVTMHMFLDFQCHFCLSFHNETLPLIVDDFVRDGQVKLVFHDFPRLGTDQSIANPDDLTVELSDPNNQSSLASQAAMCAGEQDEYLQMSDRLFGNYGGVQTGAFNRANLNRFADDMGLDMGQFNECMDSGRYIPALAQSVEQGQNNGITATPMFILDNGSGDLNVIQQTAEGYNLIKRQIEVSIQTAP